MSLDADVDVVGVPSGGVVPTERIVVRVPPFRLGPNANVVLPEFRIKGRTLFVRKDIMFVGFTSDPTYFVNSCYAEVMHVASVVARKDPAQR